MEPPPGFGHGGSLVAGGEGVRPPEYPQYVIRAVRLRKSGYLVVTNQALLVFRTPYGTSALQMLRWNLARERDDIDKLLRGLREGSLPPPDERIDLAHIVGISDWPGMLPVTERVTIRTPDRTIRLGGLLVPPLPPIFRTIMSKRVPMPHSSPGDRWLG